MRGELLGAEHLAERARAVARDRRFARRGHGRRKQQAPLLARLGRTSRILDEAHARLGADRDADVGPAGEWLLDNFHVVQEHIREVRESLPHGYYRELPELTSGPLAGYPRVYELAITIIAHTEGRIDLDNVELFIDAFQEIAPLSIGELWAMPAMLRLGLIENVRRMALRTVQRLDDIVRAGQWAARILAASDEKTLALDVALTDFAAHRQGLSATFVCRFLQQLHLAPGLLPPLMRLEQWISEEGLGAEEAASRANQRLAHTQIMMANSITSLRAISYRDWRAFVERQSQLEAVLLTDPSGFYPRMTFATRDLYRHKIEHIAKRSGQREGEVARMAVELASTGQGRQSHVGYYLIDAGAAELEAVTGYRPTIGKAIHRWVLRHPNTIFVGGIATVTVTALAGLRLGTAALDWMAWVPLLLLAAVPATDIAVNVMNQLITAFLPPRILPKLDLREQGGIPEELRTAVVIPTLFGSVDAVREGLDNLEVQYLANRGAHLHFALLSDFTDATTEVRDGDAEILAAAVEGVRALNARYASDADHPDAFYLFHRPRRWNARQGVWMGWERKRGKLGQFNRFLRSHDGEAFSAIVGDVATIQKVRYVITLDADTVLPPDAAALLVGTIAHPLNRAVFDGDRQRIVAGYGIIQPRVVVSLPSAHRSHFAAIHSGHPGVDPYTTAVSDVYQDLYGEGSFTGKGIYEVDAFEQATLGRFPENTLLSHDLIEGNYARAGLATDINVYDDYPTRYTTYSRRKHRWIRGDWQLLTWLVGRVPGPEGPVPNRLSTLSRWKVLDNLRRSTVEIAQLLFLVASWTVLPGSPLVWTLLGIGFIAAPWALALLLVVLRPPLDKSWRAYYAAAGREAVTSLQQVALVIVFLPHQAWVSADAIVRTLWRLFVSKRNLLDWQTASQVERVGAGKGPSTWSTMWPAVATAVAILVAMILYCVVTGASRLRLAQVLIVAVPIIVVWALSPELARDLSAAPARRERRLRGARRVQATRYALLHWRFFDRFVTAETHWLAPDNYQDDPAPVVAMRTSPTNMGLQLLATVSAYDLGFITIEEMTDRLELSFRTLEQMRRFRGHFYNWYDLHDLRVLEPAYVSTVDSGNLAGHLIALRQACLGIADDPAFDGRLGHSLEAALSLAAQGLSELAAGEDGAPAPVVAAAEQSVDDARAALRAAAGSAGADKEGTLAWLASVTEPLAVAVAALAGAGIAAGSRAREWLGWCLSLVAKHRERLGGLTSVVAHGRNGEVTFTYASYRKLAETSPATSALVARLDALATRAYEHAMAMDFRFLYDEARKLFSIGYQETSHTRDSSYYDLLASEARLASFIAIAKNDVPVDHWFRLGRSLTYAGGSTALVSWSGSMFEYLMPPLVMVSFASTILDQTHQGAVRRQITYGKERGVPWGVSESAYNLRDRQFTYQYRAFGVPDLALKRGLGRDLVIAPYASVLATMIDSKRALANLTTLEKMGTLGPYGFRDAIDYTRPPPGRRYAVVGNYMAHHIGMSLVALTNTLRAGVWPRRFHQDPMVRSAELLLHERIPRALLLQQAQETQTSEGLPDPALDRPTERQIDTPFTDQPHVALLGHLPYTIMVTQGGAGYSRYEDLAVTRWRADGTRDHTGQFCYIKDLTKARVWSSAHQPVCAPVDRYRAVLATDRVTFHRADGDIETRTEVVVIPTDAAEVRRVTVTNNGSRPREIELTSYGEIVMAPPDADRAHPAFANLFVETEWHEWCSAITATRRARSAQEKPLWCVHVVDTSKERVGAVSFETDRSRFIGRGRTRRDPISLESDGPLSCTAGAVLDPIFALRTRVRLDPGQAASVAFTTIIATTREQAFQLADRYHDPYAAQRALDLAWAASQVELRELKITPADAGVFQELAGYLFFASDALRAPQAERRRNRGSQALLWAAGISGDWPIVLAMIDSPEGLPTLRQLFAAHHYWLRRGMTVDLVVINMQPSGYLQELNEKIMEAVFASGNTGVIDRPGGVFVRRRDGLGAEDLQMLRATARVHITCDGRSLARIISDGSERMAAMAGAGGDAAAGGEESAQQEQYEQHEQHEEDGGDGTLRLSERMAPQTLHVARRMGARASLTRRSADALRAGMGRRSGETAPEHHAAGLAFDNGVGGLEADGTYQLQVRNDAVPPAPWSNVIANAKGGFLITERGGGCTWAENSYFFRLTPWYNDPVSDPPGEALYLRDDQTGELWTATPAPIRRDIGYIVRHGAGTSSFEHELGGIATRLTLGMAGDEAVKISLLSVTNRGPRPRRLTVTSYAEWALGVLREHTQHQIHTSFLPEHGAVVARNYFDPQFAGWVAFHAMSEVTGHTADRREFMGRNGSLADPAALGDASLSGTTGAGIDPCAVIQCHLDLAPGETREVAVLLGAADGEAEARRMMTAYRAVADAKAAMGRSIAGWTERLSVITVKTPEPSFDAMVNKWTLYQALSCRMWARSALYQSSGAYGFRDQLQDVMAFVYAEPALAREHIVRAAARQFVEGDVQHWWHPQSGRGVRTRFSDDLVWLPYVVDHYVRVTGDVSILDESVPFLAMRPLEPHEHEVYDLPAIAPERATIYEHCLRALRRACTAGAHELPLIGIGDWNDGMNRVGVDGRGESVWLAWFLVATLRSFAAVVESRGDGVTATDLRARADAYAAAVEQHGWDGKWYRRAYFDDGSPLGSSSSDECRIDAIAQSWSVISGAGESKRQAQAMASFEEHLVQKDARLLMLLTPPFDKTTHDPGYIKGYLPGVRENGAQYTHAALWSVLATARTGDGDRTFELFQMLNPLLHARTPEEVAVYKVEPYVVAADVYTASGQLGRGGWTWYTGSASWMYRVGVESILGFTKRGNTLQISPCVPRAWKSFRVDYRFGESVYAIDVQVNASPGAGAITLDGRALVGTSIPLVDDRRSHQVTVVVAAPAVSYPRAG